jgi:hypothetical protein
MRLHCTIFLPEEPIDINGKTIEVSIEDASLADSSAIVLGSYAASIETVTKSGRRLGPLEVSVDLPDAKSRYNVRAKITSDGTVKVGDLVSTQSYPLLSNQSDVAVDIKVNVVH